MSITDVNITIDRQVRSLDPGLVMGQDLINLAGITGNEQLLVEVPDELDVPVQPTDAILITGGEKFSIGDGSPQIEDNPHFRHPVQIFLNGEKVPNERAFKHPKVTAAQLKALDPNLQPGDRLVADLNGIADEPIADEQRIILQRKDKFIVVPCGNVGFTDLLESQLADVRVQFPRARLEEQGPSHYLVVEDFPTPSHWSVSSVTLLVLVPNGFPMAALDMFWVSPKLVLLSGGAPQGASDDHQHLGTAWQQFSWHYSNQASWRVGQSGLVSHLHFCQTRLALAI